MSVAAAVTAGTLSSPGAREVNGGPQFSARVATHPATGLVAAVSLADGRFLSRRVRDELPAQRTGTRYAQRTWGADVEYSRDHWVVRGELVHARWNLPVIGEPAIDRPLRSTGISVEGRYRAAPGLTLAARVDHLGFSRLEGTYLAAPWDGPVTRIETGLAYALTRQLIARLSLQVNDRARGDVRRKATPAAQVTWWF